MDVAQTIVFDLGWIFFIAWATVLAAVSAVAFGRDFLPPIRGRREPKEHPIRAHSSAS